MIQKKIFPGIINLIKIILPICNRTICFKLRARDHLIFAFLYNNDLKVFMSKSSVFTNRYFAFLTEKSVEVHSQNPRSFSEMNKTKNRCIRHIFSLVNSCDSFSAGRCLLL